MLKGNFKKSIVLILKCPKAWELMDLLDVIKRVLFFPVLYIKRSGCITLGKNVGGG